VNDNTDWKASCLAAESKLAELAAVLDATDAWIRSYWNQYLGCPNPPDCPLTRDVVEKANAILASYRSQVEREVLERVFACRPPDYVVLTTGQKLPFDRLAEEWAEAIAGEFNGVCPRCHGTGEVFGYGRASFPSIPTVIPCGCESGRVSGGTKCNPPKL